MRLRQGFRSATLRLTLWYLLILTLLSLLFSLIVYSIASHELHRPLKPGPESSYVDDDLGTTFEQLRQQREEQAKQSLLGKLVLFNIGVIATGGLASYLLARRTLQPIEEAVESQSRFSSDAAHELRTPLAVMQSEIEIGLRERKPTVASQRALLESNLDEVNRLRTLTDRLLLLSSDKTVQTGRTALDEAATEAVNRVIPLAQAKHISIESTVGTETANANAELLADTLTILLDNAIKYSPAKSQVQISSQQQGKHVILQVKDNGQGIEAKDLPHVFDRFYRADASRTKAGVEGHGLGLSIAKRSVEAMDGSIAVVSNPGEGTIFVIRLQSNK